MHYISWSTGSYEYFSKEPPTVFRDYETFTPSFEDLIDGYVVVVEYTTYDSETEYSEVYRHVVDVFKTSENAEECALGLLKLVKYQSRSYGHPEKPLVLDAAGSPVGYTPAGHWGNSFQKVVVQYVIKDNPNNYRKEYTHWSHP